MADDADETAPEAVANAALGGLAGLASSLSGGIFDDHDEKPAEEEPSEPENALSSLIDKASHLIDDVGSRLEGAVRDIGLADADGDKIRNQHEITIGTDPMNMDTDGDGLADGTEYFGGLSDPLKKDTDGDGRSDFREFTDNTDPMDEDDYNAESPVLKQTTAETLPTIHDAFDFVAEGVADAVGLVAGYPNSDPDGDGLTVADEFERGTNPWVRDTDGDNLDDGLEVQVVGTDPLRWDSDADGLGDGKEHVETNSDPLNIDSDGDGVSDGLEHMAGTLGQPNRVAVVDGQVADIVTGTANADPGQIEQEQPADVDGSHEPSVDDDVTEVVFTNAEMAVIQVDVGASELPADDGAIGASDADFPEAEALPIVEEPDFIEVEVPVEAVAVEEPQVDEPEPLQDRFEDIDESMDSLIGFDDSTD